VAHIEDTLKELDRWYNELPGGTDRPKFLSKLATLELCGWIEQRLDALVHKAGSEVGLDSAWIDSNVVQDNFGFTYQSHLRKMLGKVCGEFAVAHLEDTFEKAHPGTLDLLKGSLTTLSKSRGHLAHTHSAAAGGVPQQVFVNAPSWALNQHRVISKMLDKFEASIPVAFQRKIAVI
jgi:hypothetical protein